MPWVYAESFTHEINQLVESQNGFTRNVEFWHDLTSLDSVDIRIASGSKVMQMTLSVFQNIDRFVGGKPVIWVYGLLPVESLSEAYTEARKLPDRIISLVSLATRIILLPSRDPRIVEVTISEHGWVPHFEDRKLVGIDVLQTPPVVDEEGREYEARRFIPYYQPTIGSVTNEKYLPIYFQDAIRQIDGDVSISAEYLHIGNEEILNAKNWLRRNSVEDDILHLTMPYYVAALTQTDPKLQFLMLWNWVEQIVNSLETEKFLSEETINQMLDIVKLEGDFRSRVSGALHQITTLTFREKVEASFSNVFGACLDNADKTIAGLRAKRSAIVHPRSHTTETAEIIECLNSIRCIVEQHLNLVRDRIYAQKTDT